jgi:serine protease Do
MTEHSKTNPRARRMRNALLASAFTIGLAGAAGFGGTLIEGRVALADPVQVEAPAPADFTAVVESVRPAVVTVQVRTETEASNRNFPEEFQNLPPDHPLFDFFEQFRERGGNGDDGDRGRGMRPFNPDRGLSQGSGFFISEDGYLVTNYHVVEDATEYTVIMDDGTELQAELIGSDQRTDLALLKVDGNDFTYVRFADEEPRIGQWVIAVGNPFGLGGTVTAGIISAAGRDIGSGPYDNYLQIDAPVNNGNSGGPTFNTQGEVVGVNTAIYSPSGGNVGIAFAIPANTVGEIVGDLRDDGIVTRGWLGVRIQPVTADIAESLGVEGTDGAIVAEAQLNSPAAEAGIEAGDIITAVNGQAVSDPKTLSETIARLEPEEQISVTVLRDGDEREIEVTLGNLADLDDQMANVEPNERGDNVQPGSLDGLGMTVEENPDGDGVVVTGVEDGSPASETGIESGDVIIAIGGEPVESVADVEEGISAAEGLGRDAVLFRVQDENGSRFVGVPFERG